MIKFENIVKIYRSGTNEFMALKGIDFEVEKGELVAVVGPSGSGKSTTMNIIGLLDRPTTGKYYLLDKDASNLNYDQQAHYRNQFIGFIFQSFFLLPRLTAIQNVGLPLMYRNVDKKEIKERSQRMLEQVGLGDQSNNKPKELSGGQQQRVAIARALVGEPALILADEPTGALDVKTSDVVMNMLINMNREKGQTIVIITHDLEVAEKCDRTIHIYDGNIRER